MTAPLVVLILTGVVVGITAVAGAGLFALIVIPIGIGVAIWLALAGSTRERPSDVVREADQQEFLGPGGPDDPNR